MPRTPPRSTPFPYTTLFRSTTGGSATRSFTLTSQWRRISMGVALGLNTSSVEFGAELGAGASVDLFGMQAEAQIGASDRSEEHTSELQSPVQLVCRLLLEKK